MLKDHRCPLNASASANCLDPTVSVFVDNVERCRAELTCQVRHAHRQRWRRKDAVVLRSGDLNDILVYCVTAGDRQELL